MKQVITITPSGVISGLQKKQGQGINLQKLGRAKTQRVSLILWDEETQAWFVEFIAGPLRGRKITAELWDSYGLLESPTRSFESAGATVRATRFNDYDDAVAAEIAVLDAARLRGEF